MGAWRTSPPASGDGCCVEFPKQSNRSYEEQRRSAGGETWASEGDTWHHAFQVRGLRGLPIGADRFEVVRERESYEDLIRGESIPEEFTG